MARIVLYICVIVAVTTISLHWHAHAKGAFDWMSSDKFDEIDSYFRSVSSGTCRSRNKVQLQMSPDVVSQLPVYNQLLSKVWYTNRTSLIHLHNMALNRAFFYSYILQKMNDSASFSKQPNWLYFYLSSAADVNANPFMLNGSALYFDNNCHYPNWYMTVSFNNTIPLFAPKAFRWDDYQDPDNLLREPTRRSVKLQDAGSGTFHNYTHPGYKMNTWYQTWLPDVTGDRDSLTKFTYNVGVKRSRKTGQFLTRHYENFAFFGPSSPGANEQDSRMLPVQWTKPYFDCGGSNKWVVSAVSPVVDYMPRYSNYTHLRRHRIVALVVMDIDLNKIDFNACGISPGNPGPSYLSGIHKCKKTTSCKHIPGYGLKRGGYKCVCKAGTKYPWSSDPTFLGSDIEQATQSEYEEGFNCEPTNHGLVLPVTDNFRGVQAQFSNTSPKNQSRQMRSPRVGNNNRNGQPITLGLDSNSRHHETSSKENQPTIAHIKKTMLTLPEVMELADQLRKFQQKNEQVASAKTPDDYVIKNQVDTDIEIQYQRDLTNHRTLQVALLSDTRNMSRARETLQDSLVKIRDRHIERFYSSTDAPHSDNRRRRSVFDESSFNRMMRILSQKASVTASTCHEMTDSLLHLPGDVGYGVEKQFEPEGRTALRLSHFLSMYLQNAQPGKNFGNIRGGGYLREEHLFGEVLANVMGNFRIVSAGLFFDRNKFVNPGGAARDFFGPWTFRKDGSYFMMDTAGLSSQYVDQDWFLKAKSMFQTTFEDLSLYKIRAHVRSNPKGASSIRFGFYPITYRAASYAQGFWTRPYFRCDGNVDAWVMTYVSPFFGLDSLRSKLEFRGVTTVDVPLDLLEINQCPQPFTVANAFKNTAKCDYFSTTCSPLSGFPFSRGAYMCSCRLGFEYWHADGKEWFEGSFVELEYEKKRAGFFSRFDHLYCRPSSASLGRVTCLTLFLAVLMLVVI